MKSNGLKGGPNWIVTWPFCSSPKEHPVVLTSPDGSAEVMEKVSVPAPLTGLNHLVELIVSGVKNNLSEYLNRPRVGPHN
jgi:hypothetical protein